MSEDLKISKTAFKKQQIQDQNENFRKSKCVSTLIGDNKEQFYHQNSLQNSETKIKINYRKPAGLGSDQLMNEANRANIVAKTSIRTYNQSTELDRSSQMQKLLIKDHNFYSKTDSLWNEPQRLEPNKFARYSEKNIDPSTTFKKSLVDLQAIKENEKIQKHQEKSEKIATLKTENKIRYNQRQLERLIWQYQAHQKMTEDQIRLLERMKEEDPQVYEVLASKKKWTSVQKNPLKAIRSQNQNNQYWNLLNNLPQKAVDSVVTENILKMDERSCDRVLQAILQEKQQEDFKNSIKQRDRLLSMNKTALKHNMQISLLENIGVQVKRSPIVNQKIKSSFINQFSTNDSVGQQSGSTLPPYLDDYVNTMHNQKTLNSPMQRQGLSFQIKNNNISQKAGQTKKSFLKTMDQSFKNLVTVGLGAPLDQAGQELEAEQLLTSEKLPLQNQYQNQKHYKVSPRTDILAMPKKQYHGQDFFQRQEFRNFFIADHQEALGERAFQKVDKLNSSTVPKFTQVTLFRQSLEARKTQESFYKQDSSQIGNNSNSNNQEQFYDQQTNQIQVKFQSKLKEERNKSIAAQNNTRNQEFEMVPSKSKNLKSMASTPVPVLSKQKESKLVPINQNQQSFNKTDGFRSFNISPNKLQTYDSVAEDEIETKNFSIHNLEPIVDKVIVNQVPKNSSTVDFNQIDSQYIKKRNQRPNQSDYIEVKPRSFHPGPTQSIHVVRQENPKVQQGIGHESQATPLRSTGGFQQRPGVFTKSEMSPIIQRDDYKQGLVPLPYSNYLNTGGLLTQELFAIHHNKSPLKVFTTPEQPIHLNSRTFSETKGSHKGNGTSETNSRLTQEKIGYFQSERIKERQAQRMRQQDSGELFQSKNFLQTDMQINLSNVKDLKSIHSRRDNIFK